MLKVLFSGGTQGRGHTCPVLFIHLTVPIHISQSKRTVPGTQGNMLGMIFQGHGLGIGRITSSRKDQVVRSLRQSSHRHLQVTRPASAVIQFTAVGALDPNLSLVCSTNIVSPRLPKRHTADGLSILSQFYLDPPALEFIQTLGVVDSQRGCNASRHAASGRSRKGRGVQGTHHGRRYERRQHPGLCFLLHDTTSFPHSAGETGGLSHFRVNIIIASRSFLDNRFY